MHRVLLERATEKNLARFPRELPLRDRREKFQMLQPLDTRHRPSGAGLIALADAKVVCGFGINVQLGRDSRKPA